MTFPTKDNFTNYESIAIIKQRSVEVEDCSHKGQQYSKPAMLKGWVEGQGTVTARW